MDPATISLIVTQSVSFVILLLGEILKVHPSATLMSLLNSILGPAIVPPEPVKASTAVQTLATPEESKPPLSPPPIIVLNT